MSLDHGQILIEGKEDYNSILILENWIFDKNCLSNM